MPQVLSRGTVASAHRVCERYRRDRVSHPHIRRFYVSQVLFLHFSSVRASFRLYFLRKKDSADRQRERREGTVTCMDG